MDLLGVRKWQRVPGRQADRLYQSRVCQGGYVPGATDGSMPVGSGRFRDHAQDPRGILGMSFSSSLASNEASCGHTLTVGHAGEKVALLAQLRLPLETSSISIQPKEISLPCSAFTPFFFRSRNGYPK